MQYIVPRPTCGFNERYTKEAMIRRFIFGLFAVFLLAPSIALAAGTAAVGALSPGATVGVGTRVTFSMVIYGFTGPTYSVIDSFAGGVNNSNIDYAGNFSWTPNQDDVGAHNVAITVSDSLGNSASASQSITVIKPDVFLGQLSPGAVVRYGNPVSFSVTSVGFAVPSYSIDDSFSGSSVWSYNLNSSGSFYWTPLYRDIGTHTLTITGSDMQGHIAAVKQIITVEGVPSVTVLGVPPSISAGSLLTFSATTTGFLSPSFTVTDLFYTGAATSTLKLDGNKVSWTPVYNDIGVHTFVISATDSAGHSASTKVSVTVGPPNSAPVQTPPPAVVPAATPSTQSAAPAKTATPSYVFKSFLTVGSRGAEVTALQKKLIGLGLLYGQATGYFGQLTKKAVQAFQKSKGLEQVGFTGPMTRAALNK